MTPIKSQDHLDNMARQGTPRRLRDMTRREFNDALRRRGWRKVLVWIEIGTGRSIGMVMIGGKINLRASLAHAIRESQKETAQ